MKKRPISVGRRPVNGDAGGGAQTDRPTLSFEEVVLSMQERLQGLEQKYTSFVSRCLAVLKERKALLTARISGEGGLVDETFRVEMSELSREKDCIEEDIRYMLELKRGNKRKETGLMDLIKTVDRTCVQSRGYVLTLIPPELQSEASEAFQSLQRSLQTALIDFNNGKAQHFQEVSLLVKQLQADNSSLQSQFQDTHSLVRQMRQEKLDLQEKLSSLQSHTPSGSSESPSFSHRDDSLDSPHFPTTDRLRTDSSPLRGPTDSEMSRLKRKLIAVTKERDLLKVWKQNHVSLPPPALALMQQLRTELANCTEKHQTLKTYFSDKLKGLTTSASTFLTVSERAVYRRDASIMGTWEQCRAALLSALQSNSAQPKDFDLAVTRHVSVQTSSEETRRTGEDAERRKLLGRLKALEEAVRAEQGEVSKLAKMKAEYENQNEKLTLTVTELRRMVDQLTTEKSRCLDRGTQSADLEARVKELEKDRKVVIDRWQSEKIAKDRLREECNRARMREEEVGQKLSQVTEVAESQLLHFQGMLEPLEAYLERIAAASQALRLLQTHCVQLRKEERSQLASFRELQARNSTVLKELTALRVARETLQAEAKERQRTLEVAMDKISTLQKKVTEASSLNEELEEALGREKEVSSDLLAELQQAKALPFDSQPRNCSFLEKELEQVTAERDSLAFKLQQSGQLEGQLAALRLEVERERRKWEEKVATLEREIAVLRGNETKTKLEVEQMQREIQAKSEHFEEEKIDLESYINAQNQNIREVETDLQAVSEERHRLETQFQAISALISTQWSKFAKEKPLQDNISGLLQDWQANLCAKASLEGVLCTLQALTGTSKDLQIPLSDQLERTVTCVQTWASSLQADLEHLRLSKDHLTELFLKLDGENEKLDLLLERSLAEAEDLRGCYRREQLRKGSAGQFKWEREREILFQGFEREKSELKAAYEQDLSSLRAQIALPNRPKQPIAAEDLESDTEIQLIEGEELTIEVAEEPEAASAPLQGCEALYQALCEKAAAENRDLTQIMQQLEARCEFKQTQTSFKYGDPSYLSMEEDISAVEGALRPDGGSEGHTESFEQAAGSLGLSHLPSFEVSEESTPKSKHLPELPFLDKVVRKLQTEPREDLSVLQQCKSLQRELEDEIQTNRLMEQQLQLLKEEIQQKDRQLQRLGQDAKPTLSPEVLGNAFLKLIKSLPQL